MPPVLDDAPTLPLSDTAYPKGNVRRALHRHLALLLLTMAVVLVPNVVSYLASLLG